MAWLLRDIQTTWVRRQIPKQRVYQLKPRTQGATLPLLDFQCEVTSHSNPAASYQINLNHPRCTCPDWQTRRYKLPDGHLSKCCKHIFGAYQQAEIDESLEPWLLAFINDANPPHPLSNWFIGEVQGKTFLASTAPKGWSNVFASADGIARPELMKFFTRFDSFTLRSAGWMLVRLASLRSIWGSTEFRPTTTPALCAAESWDSPSARVHPRRGCSENADAAWGHAAYRWDYFKRARL